MFGEPNSTVTFEARHILVRAGITADCLSACGYVQPHSSGEFKKGGYFSRSSEPLNAVMSGKYDCGVGLERQVEQTPFRAQLKILARFECPSPFWACAPGMDGKVAQAFVRAMERLRDMLVLRSLPDDPDQPDGFERTTPAHYATFEAAQAEVARFGSTNQNSL
jgi:hypothetical protein